MESSLIVNDDELILNSETGRDWRLFNVILLGVSFLFLFTAFNTCSMVETLVLEGAKNESDVGNGYTSLSIVYGVFAASNWIAPPIVAVVGSKWSMFIGSCLYCLFIGLFLRPMAITLYIGSALVGLGAAVIWTGQGEFLTANSTKDTMVRNTGIFLALFQGSLLFGNLFVYFKFKGVTVLTSETRTTLFIVLTIVGVIGALMMVFFRNLPRNETTHSNRHLFISVYHAFLSVVNSGIGPSVSGQARNALEAFKNSFKLFGTLEMFLLFSCFAYTGFEQSFLSAVFITSVGHTGQYGSSAKQLTGLCGMSIGVGEIVGGLLFGILNDYIGKPSKSTVVLLGFVFHIIAYYTIFVTFPNESPISETDAYSYFHTSTYTALVCAFLLGLGDSSFNTQIYPIIRVLFPDNCGPACAVYKFVQSLASTASFIYSQHLLLQWQLLILVVVGAIGSMLFFVADLLGVKYERTGHCTRNVLGTRR